MTLILGGPVIEEGSAMIEEENISDVIREALERYVK